MRRILSFFRRYGGRFAIAGYILVFLQHLLGFWDLTLPGGKITPIAVPVAAAVSLVFYELGCRRYRHTVLVDLMGDLLEWVCQWVAASRPDGVASRPRANIMMFDQSGEAYIVANARMGNALDTRIRLKLGEGVAGQAWEREDLLRADLTELAAAASFNQLRGSTGTIPWNISEVNWLITKDLRTVISQPLFRANGRVIGVLNIDDVLDNAAGGYDESTEEGRTVYDILKNAKKLAETLVNELRD